MEFQFQENWYQLRFPIASCLTVTNMDLERGCYIVAALDLLLSVAGVIYGSVDLAHFSEIEDNR